ncbi:MAG: hypothetical protein OHK0046_09640 [Anaerolineae bacterium]
MLNPVDYRFLVVEDNLTLAELYARMLEHLSPRVEVIHDGLEALRYIETSPPDLVTLDINLPGISGIDILRASRLRLRLTEMKVIVMTANLVALENPVLQLADAALEKPVRKHTLIQTCQRLLNPTEVEEA